MTIATKIREAKEQLLSTAMEKYLDGAFARHPSLPGSVRTAMSKAKTKMEAKRILKAHIGSVLK